jgi:putative ABC transport system permease protein
VQSVSGVKTVSASTDVPGSEVGSSASFNLRNSDADKRCRLAGIDNNFIPSYGLTLLAGRNFNNDQPPVDTAQPLNLILNETAIKMFGFIKPADAIGQALEGAGFRANIVGVIKDYHQESLQHSFDPIVFYPEQQIAMSHFSLKLQTSNISKVMSQVKAIWNARFPESPFQYFFLDDYFDQQYRSDRLFSTVLWLFTIIAIIIASLGLFGLSLNMVTKRSKEISIRKVLGATILQITTLITSDYLKLILYAGIVAIPVAWYLLNNWLNDYAFHITIGWWFFLLPLMVMMLIAVITILYQSVKAALSNPVKNLRTE